MSENTEVTSSPGEGNPAESARPNVQKLRATFESGNQATRGASNDAGTTATDASPPENLLGNENHPDQSKESGVSAIIVHESGKIIDVTWPGHHEATLHKLQIVEGEKEFNRDLTEAKFSIKKEEFCLQNGRIFHIQVTVSRLDGSVINCYDTDCTVGGDEVPTEFHARLHVGKSHNTIEVHWNSPKRMPVKYEVSVWRQSDNMIVNTIFAEDVKATFTELDEKTKYYCMIKALYGSNESGSPVKSEDIQTTAAPRILPMPKHVTCRLDPNNPSRRIIAEWAAPDAKEVKAYECRLINKFKKRPNKVVNVEKTLSTSMSFRYLRSDKNYNVGVKAIFVDRTESEIVYSQAKRTAKAAQEDVDIKEIGKALITTCSTQCREGKLFSNFSWKLPDLHSQSENFKLIDVRASFKRMMWEQMKVLNDNTTVPAELSWGKMYSFRVTCKYQDIDTEKTTDVESIEQIETRIGKPENLEATWEKEEITFRWSHAKGATSYGLKVWTQQDKLIADKTLGRINKATFDMTTSWRYGTWSKFTVEAEGKVAAKTEATKEILIGGDSVATALELKKDAARPRSLRATWKCPERNTLKYRITLYETHFSDRSDHFSRVQVESHLISGTSHRFMDLKSITHYYYMVKPIYGHDSDTNELASASNFELSDPRLEDASEKLDNFGKPERIFHNIEKNLPDNIIIALSWTSVKINANFKLLGYTVTLEQPGRVWGKREVFSSEFGPETSSINIDRLVQGNTYTVQIMTKLWDLDKHEVIPKTKTYQFQTNPSITKIHACTLEGGLITFSWDPVSGAKTYTLIVKELMTDDQLHFSTAADVCQRNVPISAKIGIGKSCRVKVVVNAENDLQSETDWSSQLIGGGDVPRNVKAVQWPQDPSRAIRVTYDQPQEGVPDSYKIVARPTLGGRERKVMRRSNNIIFEHLRPGTEYTFEVHAIYGDVATEPSISNKCLTKKDSSQPSAVEVTDMSGTLDLQNATIANSTMSINVTKDADFGKVRDLRLDVVSQGETDKLKAHWKVPAFDNNPKAFHVYHYTVEVRKRGGGKGAKDKVPFQRNTYTYESAEYILDLGETYIVSVTTFYDDIDMDMDQTSSSAEITVNTRPCKPQMHPFRYVGDEVRFEWNHAEGAKSYTIEVIDDNTKACLYKKDTNKDTSWKRSFEDSFGYGTCFYVIITAFGDNNKSNSYQSQPETIGGDHVPRNVAASSSHESILDPNTQVFLRWEEPKLKPLSYEVTSIPPTHNLRAAYEGTSCLVTGLKAGTYYHFKVFGIHFDSKSNSNFKSCGCQSRERVQTNPTPTQVKDVQALVGKEPSRSIRVKWGRVDAEKADEQVKYRVTVTSQDKNRKSEIYVETEQLDVQGLDPGQTYHITVAGGNSLGFGRDSGEEVIQTEFGTPRDVSLTNDKESPSSKLILNFKNAYGQPTEYVASLTKCSEAGQEDFMPLKVHNGHPFPNLESNTRYKATIGAKYGKNEGKSVSSFVVMTAPAKPVIVQYGCCQENGENSADSFYLKWQPVTGCNVHELAIEGAQKTERSLIIKDEHEYVHACKHPMTDYYAKIRSQNESGFYGPWCNRVMIHLAPEGVKNLEAKMDDATGKIKVRCQKLSQDPEKYLMRPMCEGRDLVRLSKSATECENGVEFVYTPPENSKEYTFAVWAEGSEQNKGKEAISNAVTSRPGQGDITEIVRHASSPSTDIEMKWQTQERCDGYEVSIRQRGKEKPELLMKFSDETSYRHRCLSPGDRYEVKMRCLCKDTNGPWSQVKTIELAPAEVKLIEDESKGSDDPCQTVSVMWEELQLKPAGYIAILHCGTEEIDRYKGPDTKHNFTKTIKPGYQCYCTVAAYKVVGKEKEEIVGKPVKSKIYKIKWAKPRYLHVTPDENEPSKRAKITWDKPYGVNCFRLEIENKQNGVTTTLHTKEQEHLFESGVPANSYKVRLYCGCDSRFDSEFKEEEMIMRPIPPSDIKVNANAIAKGLEVHFQDDSISEKKYKITAEPLSEDGEQTSKTVTKTSHVFRNLVDGESYRVSVKVLLGDVSSKEAFYDDYVQTFPGAIRNLRSRFENGSIIYEWDEPNFKPNEYRVQWRCNDDPVTEEATEETNFVKVHPLPGKFYKIRVYAVNNSGSGPMSKWETFITDPSPVHSIEGYANPKCSETSLIIKFQDSNSDFKSYRVTATSTIEGDEPKVEATDCHYAIINGLVPGAAYSIEVVTLFCGKESKPAVLMDI